MRRTAIYLRVSTNGQTVENQRRELLAAAERNGWQVVAEFADEGVSGSKGRDKRPALDKLLRGVARRDFDMVAAWSVDRLGRSVQDLCATLNELRAKRVDLFLHQQGLDTSTPAGRAFFQMLGVFSELERAIIIERINAGLSRAKAQGKHLGRPRGSWNEEMIRELLAQGVGILKVARTVGCGVSTVQRVKTEMVVAT